MVSRLVQRLRAAIRPTGPESLRFMCGGVDSNRYCFHSLPLASWRREGRFYTCEHCGGLRANDVATILLEGGRLQPTDKRHKFYLGGHPDLGALAGAAKYYVWHKEDDFQQLNEVWGRLRRAVEVGEPPELGMFEWLVPQDKRTGKRETYG